MEKDYIIYVWLFIFFVLNAFFCSRVNKIQNVAPDAKIVANIENNKIKVIVQIPSDHHAYLDKGKDGMLIPITFDWSDLFTNEPQIISKPEGVFDKDVQATVLRNEGIFEFLLPENISKENITNKILKVRVQICNETTGICYRPKIYEVRL